MIFYDGEAFPAFRGDAFLGGLQAEGLTRVTLAGGAVANQELLPLGARIREVEEGPDGSIYVLTDDPQNGAVLKLAPKTD